jgi:hypothetical protein
MLHQYKRRVNQALEVTVTVDMDDLTTADKAQRVKDSRDDGTQSIYFEEDIGPIPAAPLLIQPNDLIAAGAAVAGQAALHVQVADDAVLPEPVYDSQGNYKHTGRKESYTPVHRSAGEGENAKMLFVAINIDTLKRNFAFKTSDDPNFPFTRKVKLPNLYGKGTEVICVNPKFWAFVVDEFESKQWKETIKGEERSNGFTGGAHKRWRACDFTSEEVNAVKLPTNQVGYMRPIGTD